jgi:hypothetical protein
MIHSMLVRLLLFTRLPAKAKQQAKQELPPRRAKQELQPQQEQPPQPQQPRRVKQEIAQAVDPPSIPSCMSMNVHVLHDQQSLMERCFKSWA